MSRFSRRGFISAAITAPLATALPGVVRAEVTSFTVTSTPLGELLRSIAYRDAMAAAVNVPAGIIFGESFCEERLGTPFHQGPRAASLFKGRSVGPTVGLYVIRHAEQCQGGSD